MIIDTHAHYAPQRMLDAIEASAASFPSIELTHVEAGFGLLAYVAASL